MAEPPPLTASGPAVPLPERDAADIEDTVDYTPHSRSVTVARRRTARLVGEWGHPGLAGDAALVVSELMTNALLHGSLGDRLIRVRLTATATALRAEVSDPRGERLPSPRPAGDEDQFGRGLLLVSALVDDWGSEARTVGKTVYAEWRLGADGDRRDGWG